MWERLWKRVQASESKKWRYGVALVSRIYKIIGLCCRRALWKRQYSAAKETYCCDSEKEPEKARDGQRERETEKRRNRERERERERKRERERERDRERARKREKVKERERDRRAHTRRQQERYVERQNVTGRVTGTGSEKDRGRSKLH